MHFMTIVLPAALPPAPYAAELAKILPKHAPTLAHWLSRAHPVLTPFDPEAAGCTTFESWLLEHAGYADQPGLRWGAGLGPLYAYPNNLAWVPSSDDANGRSEFPIVGGHAQGHGPISKDAPIDVDSAGDLNDDGRVWLADFVHLALGTDQATLIPGSALAITPAETKGLFEALAPVFADSGFSARLQASGRLRLTLPDGFVPETASPEAVAGHPLHAWWQTDAASRPWRRVLNEVQMVWHEHPINESRQAEGLLPINGLWLYGGAHGWPALTAERNASLYRIDQSLIAPARSGDWAAWLDALENIDATLLKPLAQADGTPVQPITLHLMGERRSAKLTLAPRPAWLRWWPQSNKNWKHWWSLPA